jgi:putative peptide zinc metalloprotease protein
MINQLAFNAMLVASFTTIVFNANPLLRYDGYYILSDFLEIPNLRQKSTEYSMGLIKRHLFGVKLQQPLPPVLQRFWLFAYAVSSSIYRAFVGVVIILLVAFQIPILGMLMALGGVATWVTVPLFKVFKYLTIEPELHRKRGRATAITLAAVAVVVALIGFIPFPLNVDEVALAEAQSHEAIRAEWGGFVKELVAHDHQQLKGPVKDKDGNIVTPGDIILVTHDPELDKQITQYQWQVKYYSDRVTAEAQTDRATANSDQDQLDAAEKQLNVLVARRERLTLRAPIDGYLVAPNLDEMTGRFLKPGEEIAEILDPRMLNMRVLTDQKEAGVIVRKDARNLAGGAENVKTEVRLTSDIGSVLTGGVPHMKPQALFEIPPELTSATGEEYQVDPKHPNKLIVPQFEIDVPVDNSVANYVPGQKAWVRFKLGRQPLAWQWYRRVLQLIQTKQASPLV